jgi:hypothetical protein
MRNTTLHKTGQTRFSDGAWCMERFHDRPFQDFVAHETHRLNVAGNPCCSLKQPSNGLESVYVSSRLANGRDGRISNLLCTPRTTYYSSYMCEHQRHKPAIHPPGGGSTIICPVGVRGYGGGSASRFSASFLIKFETYELG